MQGNYYSPSIYISIGLETRTALPVTPIMYITSWDIIQLPIKPVQRK